ncbi:MAG: carbon storage regulator [Gemmatimonadales bacterium]|nr:carbon storage regulator [Gemmatimonadales bacterium]
MLILNRRVGEAIIIAGNIRVVVLQSDRRGVRLGIEAPTEVGIQREELVSQVAAENRRARAAQTGVMWAARLAARPEVR